MKKVSPRLSKPRTKKATPVTLPDAPTNVVAMSTVKARVKTSKLASTRAPHLPQVASAALAPMPRLFPGEGAIAERAYQLFELRDRVHGHHEADWYQAEAELVAALAKPKRRKASA